MPNKRFFKPPRGVQRQKRWDSEALTITDLSHDGRGLARLNGRVVFVEGALLGEQVQARCVKSQKDFDEATLETVIKSSEEAGRIEPFCQYFNQCGGCQLQHWDHTAQLQHKQAQLFKTLSAINPQIEIAEAIVSNKDGFRHRLRFAVSVEDEKIQLGLHQQHSHQLVVIDHCPIAVAEINQVVKELPNWLSSLTDARYKSLSLTLSAVEVDCDSQSRIGLLFQFSQKPTQAFIDELEATLMPRVKAFTIQYNVGSTKKVSWQTLYSSGELTLSVQGVELCYQPGDFTQTNLQVNDKLAKQALSWLALKETDKALDLFSGMGNFSLLMAGQAKSVKAYEGESALIERLKDNASRLNVDNIEGFSKDLFSEDLLLPKANVALLDPPRSGAKKVVDLLAASKSIKRVVYVSCHPGTLARDAKILHQGGLKLIKAGIIDMFPHSGHNEAIALFER